MTQEAGGDQLAVLRVEGMHCHKCEQTVKRALMEQRGVHEVEVDFNSRQASVLYDPAVGKITDLMNAVTEAGYHAVGFSQGAANARA
jgi:copper chaperone CopZ